MEKYKVSIDLGYKNVLINKNMNRYDHDKLNNKSKKYSNDGKMNYKVG